MPSSDLLTSLLRKDRINNRAPSAKLRKDEKPVTQWYEKCYRIWHCKTCMYHTHDIVRVHYEGTCRSTALRLDEVPFAEGMSFQDIRVIIMPPVRDTCLMCYKRLASLEAISKLTDFVIAKATQHTLVWYLAHMRLATQ